ncbi:MAG TPA: nucleoside-diphosphate sugar epimerase/dehydratase [Solirubrobacteraceae bacterium]|jgi:FlaA1/EpsC-like NDP-sugar epimerase|nr:nucleoside-diphosphate sugar epimerase/dehydratase [Solirubrobacteraceae bacterium]
MRRRFGSPALSPHRHSLPRLAIDGALVALAYWLAFQLRFDNGPTGRYAKLFDRTVWWVLAGSVLVLLISRVYQRRWRYSGQRDYEAVARAVVAIVGLTVVAVEAIRPVQIHHEAAHTAAGGAGVGAAVGASGTTAVALPNGVIALFFLLSLLLLIGVRVLARSVYERRPLGAFRAGGRSERSVLIVGAGDGGRLVLREILRNPELGLNPVGFVDDDPRKHGSRIEGVKVRGDTKEDLPRILEQVAPDEVIIAIPSAPGSTRARVVRACRARSVPVRTLPTVFELLQDQVAPTATASAGAISRQVREVRVEDVLGRDPVVMELDRVGAYLAGETVLVTGAGGSIGSELCRQIARVGPRRIVLLDHAEDNLFAIERELGEERHVHPSVLAAVLADCREEERMREVLAEHRPTVIFHAAAYKHVGLMESNPVEAVRNNAIATRVMAHVAGEGGVGRFVLVSTDKAVAPATVMGASKALAEFALEAATARFHGTRYAAVRFGNVLGSSGSVVPIFRRQIERGGPVTVTDERMTRYFMTIPEAVQLIIRSGTLTSGGARGADVFVLDMGEPVRIVELARAMIELSGLDPDRDVEIEIVGRRAGEKLHEELFNGYERPCATAAEKIMLAEREPLAPETVEAMFDEIGLLVLEGDAAGLAARVSELSAVRAELSEKMSGREGAYHRDAPVPLIDSRER